MGGSTERGTRNTECEFHVVGSRMTTLPSHASPRGRLLNSPQTSEVLLAIKNFGRYAR
jgi:hypothetical protein